MDASTTSNNDSDECVTLGRNSTIPWDNPNNLISVETEYMIDKVTCGVIMPILYLIGSPANIINMVVFFKQGLNTRINVCLFLLALVDFLFLNFVLLYNAQRLHSLFADRQKFGTVFLHLVNNNMPGLYGFGYSSISISAIISIERCVCVLLPLRAQRCIPTKVFAAMIIIIACVIGFMRFAITAKYRAACFYEMRTWRKSWQISVNEYYFQNKELLDILDGIIYGFCVSVGGPLIVLITTIITAIKLQQTVRWRSQASSQMSSKEIGVTKMLIYLSIEFVILSVPSAVNRFSPIFEPQITAEGQYANTFLVMVSISETCMCTSSSVNFFVYYFNSSRYRETLHNVLGWKTSSQRSHGQHPSSRKFGK